ncbi:MAG: M16 family metallopeptidase [Acidimicrobiia bacterium]
MTTGVSRRALEGGLRVVTERLPELRSVAVGFWIGTGSRDEPENLAGASHFLEHLLFKGTDRRSASEIAEDVESVGGDMNAFTTHECTAFVMRMPYEQLERALTILSDIVWTPALLPPEVEQERQVILEEIRMRDDTPDDLVHDLFSVALFPNHPLGREVLGGHESIRGMARDSIAEFHGEHYRPSNVVVAAAGDLDHDQVVELVARALPDVGAAPEPDGAGPLAPPQPVAVLERTTEQAHLVVGTRGLPRNDADRYAMNVLNQAIGGGMSSRLFQEVREKRGLAYSVYSYAMGHRETGVFAIYAGTAPERVDEVLAVVTGELDRLVADGGLPVAEIESAKGHLKGSLALALETSSSRMHRIGRNELLLGEVQTLDEVAAEIEAVGPEDVARVVDRVFAPRERVVAAVGPVDEAALSSSM